MFFSHDEKSLPTKVSLIDLAISRWANPCTDLVYFLYLSTTPQLRKTHLDYILECYHNTFVRTLVKLGEDPATYTFR